MSKVVAASAWLADLEVETPRTDAVQAFLKQETVFVRVNTADGNTGVGYGYTIGTGGSSVPALLRDHLLPRLIGADATLVEQLWYDLFASTRATTVGAITSLAQFRDYLERGAASIVQADVARVGGITPWLKIAHPAEAFNVHICPHFLMELHVSLVAAVPNGRYVEHIPQSRAITGEGMRIEDGHAVAPDTPGLGIDWDFDAIEDRTVA
jgi:L-alanine-DL-glutamate epimerase-like enolase superfamily enzyme